MKKFLRLFALCTMFMVSAFTHPALANTNNEAKIQTIENNTEKVIQGAVITVTAPKRDWDAPTCTTNEYGACILTRPSGEINDRFNYIITHKNYKDKEGGPIPYANNQVRVIYMTPKGITVTGTITDQAAQPVEGVIVHLEDESKDKSKGKSKRTTSNADGQYKIEELTPGSKLIFEHTTYNTTEFTVPQDTPNPSDIEQNITLTESYTDIASVEVSNETCSGNGIAKGFKHENNICYPYECESDYTLMSQDNKKVEIDQTDQAFRSKLSKLNTTCKKTQDCTTGEGIESSAYVLNNNTYICKVTCKEKQYKANNTETKCIPETQCHDTDLPLHATEGVYIDESKGRRCKATKCEKGYTPNKDGSECVGIMALPEDKSASRIGELETLYNTAHDNETSIANKILGTASMAATGSGGMMLASGLTEQKADQEAEEKMRGYVATFKCNYGNTNVEYGTQPTELPTSTELYNLYAEYVTLANDLKLRKDVLGMRAGIESEPILNSATSGLYDDVSSGRSAGMYTSLARAILDPNGADAAAWAEQTKKSKNLVIAGATTAGVGVIGSIVGNVLINKDAPNLQYVREEIDKINKKYKEFYKEIEKIADDLDGTITMKNDADKDEDEPEPMGGNDNPPQNGDDPTEVKDNPQNGDDPTEVKDNPLQDGKEPVDVENDGEVGIISDNLDQTPTDITLSIPGSTLFKLGEHNVIPAAREIIKNLVKALSELAADTQIKFDNVITVNGYTDPVDKWDINQTLSQKRADAVMNIIVDKVKELNNNYLTQIKTDKNTVGNGETGCTCAAGIDIKDNEQVIERRNKYSECRDKTKKLSDIKFESSETNDTNTKFPPCRRVEISITLPKISAEALSKYGFTVGDSEISISDFIEKINQSDVASTK